MGYVVRPPEIPSLAVKGEEGRFPVRRIFCVGRNYAAHAREMGRDPDREPPFFFCKPADAAFDAGPDDGARIPYPPETENLHYEAELTVAIGTGGTDIPQADALGHVYGWAASLDLTRRDLQLAARDAGRPWDWGKAFDRSAPIGTIARRDDAPGLDLRDGAIRLLQNGETRQDAVLGELIWSVPEVIAAISRSMALRPGDLVMTGTPAGVGPIRRGDALRVEIDGLPACALRIG